MPREIQNTQTPQAGNLVPIGLDSVVCNGIERSLSECYRATYVEGCTHAHDVGVNCTQTIGELQLELGPSLPTLCMSVPQWELLRFPTVCISYYTGTSATWDMKNWLLRFQSTEAFMSRVIFAKNYRSAKMKQNLLGVEKNPYIRTVHVRLQCAKYGTWCKISPQLVLVL